MRIELPPPSWADAAPRSEDDAHTLTVAASGQPDWVQWQWPAERAQTARVGVPAGEPATITLTL